MSYQIIPLSKNANDLTFQVFGRLMAIAPIRLDKRKLVIWLCVCHCGKVIEKTGRDIKKPGLHSCGCVRHRSHGATNTREFVSWRCMIQRCTNKNHVAFSSYGGRGITIYGPWFESFENFYKDMGACPEGHSLDRIENSGNYCPENCRWANRHEQANNTKKNIFVTYKGRTHTMAEWARELNIKPETFRMRVKRWHPIEKVFETPVRK